MSDVSAAERKKANDRAWYWSNRDKKLAYLAEYKEKNRERVNAKQREYEAANPRRNRPVDRQKQIAQSRLNQGISKGEVERQPCEYCGSTRNVVGHHPDYDKPLDVIWLCQKHHTLEHRRGSIIAALTRRKEAS